MIEAAESRWPLAKRRVNGWMRQNSCQQFKEENMGFQLPAKRISAIRINNEMNEINEKNEINETNEIDEITEINIRKKDEWH